MKDDPPYRKFVYWLEPDRLAQDLSRIRQDRAVRVHNAKHHPCEALYPRREMVLVEPRAWDLRCARQGSWYRASARNGHSLLVSNQPLEGLSPWGTVTLERFAPPRRATDQDVLELLRDPRAADLLPLDWGAFSPWERQAIHELLLQEDIERSLQEVFCYYTANHLNFVFPRFFLPGEEHPVVPYSIQSTALVCSACVEIFGVLGESFPVKYLVPCPGLKYLRPPPGTWIRVDRL